MQINERSRQLRKAIPAAISELSEAMQPQRFFHSNQVAERLAAVKDFLLLAEALKAAASAALLQLEPPQPEVHNHVHNHPPERPQRPTGLDPIGTPVR